MSLKEKDGRKTGFDKDMQTLHFMLTGASRDGKLTKNFEWGVFIQIGETIKRLEKYVKQHSFNDNIWCIVVNDRVSQLTIETIGELKNSL